MTEPKLGSGLSVAQHQETTSVETGPSEESQELRQSSPGGEQLCATMTHEWRLVRLEDVAIVNPPRPSGLRDNTIISFLSMSDVSEEAQIVNSRSMPYTAIKSGFTPFRNGDVLIAKITPCFENGKGALVRDLETEHGFGSTEFHVLRAKPSQILPEFLYYHMVAHDFRQRGRMRMVGSAGQKRVPRDFVAAYEILLPSLSEQHRIAEVLAVCDRVLDLLERKHDARQLRKQGLMQQLLTGKVRFPEFTTSQTSRQTDYGQIPPDWRIVPLGELMTHISRPEVVKPDKTYRLIGVKWYVAGAHIHETVLGASLKISSLSRVEINDIIYNKMWTTKAAFAVARDEHAGAYGTGEYPQFRAREDLLDVAFLRYLYYLPRFQHAATSLCRGTTGRARLNPSDFLKLEVPLPPLKEQRRIVNLLDACDRELDLLARKRDALQRQKRGLMQQLLTGRVRVKV